MLPINSLFEFEIRNENSGKFRNFWVKFYQKKFVNKNKMIKFTDLKYF